MKSILIKDTTKEEREQIIKNSLDCGGGCENCSSCWLGGGSPWDIYQDYIDGNKSFSSQVLPLMLLTSLKESAVIHEAAQRPLTDFLPLQLQESISDFLFP